MSQSQNLRRTAAVAAAIFVVALAAAAALPFRGQTRVPLASHLTIEIANPTALALDNHPVALDVAAVKAVLPDFDPARFAVFDPSGRFLPSQVDDTDKNGTPDRIVVIVSLPPSSTTRLAAGRPVADWTAPAAAPKTYARLAWEPQNANIGWESTLATFRLYYGQMEAFGKLQDTLILSRFPADYHGIQPWGMDIIHLGDAAGLGALGLWSGDSFARAFNPAGKGDIKIDRVVAATGPIRALARVKLDGIKAANGEFGILLEGSAFADNVASRQEVTVLPAAGTAAGPLSYGPGIQKLPGEGWFIDEKKGYAGTWGTGAEGAGDIGLGVVFPPADFLGVLDQPLERFIRLKTTAGKPSVHWLYMGWHRGIEVARAANGAEWKSKVAALAERLLAPIRVDIRGER